MVASLIAAQQGTAAIEMYIMLQFMLGSFVTTLSTLGVRLWLMSPDRLAKRGTSTATALKSFWGHTKARLGRVSIKPLTGISKEWWPNLLGGYNMSIALGLFMPFCSIFGFLGQCLEQFIYLFRIELGILSKLKPPGLSWSGVIWRMTTAAVVTGYNLAFWFDDSGGGAQQPPRQGCGPPYIFLLSKQQLTGSVIALCRAAAVIIAVVVFPPAILLLFSHRAFCSLWNVYVVLSIAWFIASIECTIHWNYIQGVNDIQTTGQLIPFVIGCKYPDWANTRLEVGDGVDGPVIFKIVKMNKGDDSEEEATKDDHIGNGQFERPIARMHIRRQSV
ncbi:unnamed protein product [Penicillium discolor]